MFFFYLLRIAVRFTLKWKWLRISRSSKNHTVKDREFQWIHSGFSLKVRELLIITLQKNWEWRKKMWLKFIRNKQGVIQRLRYSFYYYFFLLPQSFFIFENSSFVMWCSKQNWELAPHLFKTPDNLNSSAHSFSLCWLLVIKPQPLHIALFFFKKLTCAQRGHLF